MRSDSSLFSLIKSLRKRRNEIRLAMVFLGLIIIPSGLLGYFSWRALENEKLLSQERLRESYRQFARLAGREIDNELEDVEKRWISAAKEILNKDLLEVAANDVEKVSEDLGKLSEHEPLIAASFLLTAPGKVVYPPGLTLPRSASVSIGYGAEREENSLPERWEQESYLREYKIFQQLVEQGEELEYHAYDLNGAVAKYQGILSTVSNNELRAMAESCLGRALQKKGEWAAALATFQHLLTTYPEARDLNKMYVRFLAQYQMSVCLDNLERDQQAIETLLRLNQDLLERSDAINTLQYSYFLELIQALAPRLLASPHLSDAADYAAQFNALAEQNKKRISQKFFLQLLDQKLTKRLIERDRHREKFRYISDDADGEPFLLAYQSLPDPSDIYIAGLLGLQIDLAQLRQELFPAILRHLKFSEQVSLAILNEKGEFVIGTSKPTTSPIAAQNLDSPFDFWQVAIYLDDAEPLSRRQEFGTALGLWVISLLLLSILAGAYIFIRRAGREAYLSQMKSTFVSNVSHELRTPLAAIKMLAELMEMQLNGRSAAALEKSKAQHYLSIIRRECGRLGRLIENVLDFSKIERGLKQYKFEYEDPAAVMRMAIETFRPHAEAQGFTLKVEIANDLPEVRIDADAVSQVMLNLLSNAVKYSDEVKEIRVRAYRDGSLVAVEVADRGIGVEAAEIPKIFDDFYRVDRRLSSQKQGGMGLGLTLVRNIVHAHGGDVRVRSEIGKGSAFIFTLPILPDHLTVPANGEAGVEAAPAEQEIQQQ